MKKHWRSYTDSKTLGVGDLPDASVDLLVRITRIEAGNVKYADGDHRKPMIYLQGFAKPLAAGAKVCKRISALHSQFPEEWPGKTIWIYATTDKYAGEVVDAIRVRETRPPADAKAYGDAEGNAAPFNLHSTLDEIAKCEERDDVEALAASLKSIVPKDHRAAVKAALDAKRATFPPVEEPAS